MFETLKNFGDWQVRLVDIVAFFAMFSALRYQFESRFSKKVTNLMLLGLIGAGFVSLIAFEYYSRYSVALYIINFALWNLIASFVLFKGSWQYKCLYSILYSVIWVQCSQVSMALFAYVRMYWTPPFSSRIVSGLLFLPLITFLTRTTPSTKRNMPSAYFVSTLAVYIINLTLCLAIPELSLSTDKRYFQLMVAVGTLITELIVIWFSRQMLRKAEDDTLKVAYSRQRSSESRLADNAVRLTNEYHALQHEINHYLGLFETLITSGEIESAQSLLSELRSNKILMSFPSVSGNSIVDAIISQFTVQAESMGVPFSVDAHLIEDVHISALDLCSMISNMLSNALEASVVCKSPRVKLEIQPVKRYIMIRVSNAVDENVLEKNPSLATTKSNTEAHGIGTKIMKTISDKYQGMLTFDVQDGMFIAQALLLPSEPTK